MTDHTLTISDDHKTLILKTTRENWHCGAVAPEARWDKVNKEWVYPASTNMISVILESYRAVRNSWDLNVALHIDKNVQIWREQQRAIETESQALKIRDDLPEIPITKYPAWNHQLQAYHFCYSLKSAFLHMHMGTGKNHGCN